ncbi:MAG: hypothetical protein BGO31_12395 [Bacteroidetes bacterium 43-16]|nr:MAG: hypothetical protein BGO31_12395 [Bacteroidetes bacterium 43-16]
MKKILLIWMAMLLLIVKVLAQKGEQDSRPLIQKDESGQYTYQNVVTIDGVSKEVLFKRAENYIKTSFKTTDNNIQFDQESAYILNTGTIVLPAQPKSSFFQYQKAAYDFKIELWFKEGKYKVVVSNIMIYVQWDYNWTETKSFQEYSESTKKKYKRLAEEVSNSIMKVLNDLETASRQDKHTKDEEW